MDVLKLSVTASCFTEKHCEKTFTPFASGNDRMVLHESKAEDVLDNKGSCTSYPAVLSFFCYLRETLTIYLS